MFDGYGSMQEVVEDFRNGAFDGKIARLEGLSETGANETRKITTTDGRVFLLKDNPDLAYNEDEASRFLQAVGLTAPMTRRVGDFTISEWATDMFEGGEDGELRTEFPDPVLLSEPEQRAIFEQYISNAILGNEDRHSGNVMTLTMPDGERKLVLIDHGLTLENGNTEDGPIAHALDEIPKSATGLIARLWAKDRDREEVETVARDFIRRIRSQYRRPNALIENNVSIIETEFTNFISAIREEDLVESGLPESRIDYTPEDVQETLFAQLDTARLLDDFAQGAALGETFAQRSARLRSMALAALGQSAPELTTTGGDTQ